MSDNANRETCRNGLHDWEQSKVWRSGQWLCLACRRASSRKCAYQHPPKSTPERRAAANRAARASAKKYPEKARARNAVARAIRRGELARPETCARCATPCKPEASHDDYAKPLAVEWLCRRCHATKDRGLHVLPI